ncbi:MAG: Multidrug resistance protein stp [Syntrophorhabdaceae bacterium PtaU1.Bin034]|nr:MAG: Multidrug resistance protein stp [Syntrophorhabdaceae bacterium PtaU1.Bin034]
MHAVLLSWVAISVLLSSAMFLVPFGRVADIYGRKRIFLYGVITFTASSLLCGFSGSAGALIALRFVQGIGAAMMFGTSMAILTSVYSIEERGRVLGIAVAAVYLGLSLGPFFGGFLTEHLGWRSIFLANVPFGVAIIAAVRLGLKQEWAEAKGERFDFVGSIVFSLSLLFTMYGFSLLPGPHGFVSICSGACLGVIFVIWESRVESPILNIGLIRSNRVFALSNLAALIHYSATFAVTFLLSLYLQYIRGMTPKHAGIILVCQPLVQTVFSPLAGKLSDRIEPRIVSSAGMGLTVAGLLLLSLLDRTTGLPVIVSDLALLGLGFALFASPNANAIMSSVEKRFYGVASGSIATARVMGQMFSMGFTVLVFALYIGRVRIDAASYPLFLKSAKMLFAFFGILCSFGVIASLARGKIRS